MPKGLEPIFYQISPTTKLLVKGQERETRTSSRLANSIEWASANRSVRLKFDSDQLTVHLGPSKCEVNHPQLIGAHVLSLQPVLAASLLSLLLGGCSSMLPSAKSESSPFETFEQAQTAIEGLVPMKSNATELEKLGIAPPHYPNTVILTQADIVRRFVPSGLLKREDLDAGVLACLEAKDACRGWEVTAARISKIRTGNFWADFTNFSRRQETTGWRFNGLILLVGDLVVYRSWSGQPRISELEITRNPLGPFQDIGPAVLTR